jgi:hypothetical protein
MGETPGAASMICFTAATDARSCVSSRGANNSTASVDACWQARCAAVRRCRGRFDRAGLEAVVVHVI